MFLCLFVHSFVFVKSLFAIMFVWHPNLYVPVCLFVCLCTVASCLLNILIDFLLLYSGISSLCGERRVYHETAI